MGSHMPPTLRRPPTGLRSFMHGMRRQIILLKGIIECSAIRLVW